MIRLILLLILNIYIFESIAQEKTEPWIFLKEFDEISIYYRIPEDSALKELKLSTRSETTLSAIVSTIKNIESFPKWAYLCVETSLVKVVSEVELYYYYLSDIPWPITDRDIVIHMNVSQDSISGIVTIDTKNTNRLVAEKENYVRVKKMTGKWVLTPLNNGLVQIEYYVSLNPGGNVPIWFINYTMSYGPVNTITALKKIVEEKSKMSSESLKYIKEFSF